MKKHMKAATTNSITLLLVLIWTWSHTNELRWEILKLDKSFFKYSTASIHTIWGAPSHNHLSCSPIRRWAKKKKIKDLNTFYINSKRWLKCRVLASHIFAYWCFFFPARATPSTLSSICYFMDEQLREFNVFSAIP